MTFFDKLVLRTPYLSFNSFFTSFEADIESNAFKEAIYIASPDLYSKAYETKEKRSVSVLRSLKKYHSRMTSRCTPFGLFAGSAVSQWGTSTDLEVLRSKKHLLRHTRLDMLLLCQMASHVEKNPYIKERLRYTPNSSLYTFNQNYRYVEYKNTRFKRNYYLAQIEYDPIIEEVLHHSLPGRTISELAALVSSKGFTVPESQEFIIELIESQILVSELEPSVTCTDYLDRIINILTTASAANDDQIIPVRNKLVEIQNHLRALDANGSNQKRDYENTITLIKSLGFAFDSRRVFQIDFYSEVPAGGSLNRNIQADLADLLGFLHNLQFQREEIKDLKAFKATFRKRYEQREVPLVQVLDKENGLGYPSNTEAEDISGWNKYDGTMLRILEDSLIHGRNEVDLCEISELNDIIETKPPNLPPTFAVMLKYLGSDNKGEDKIQYVGTHGSSAVNFLGRFAAHVPIQEVINEIIAFENSLLGQHSIFAEIVHLPQSRTGNVISHEPFRQFEIPYLAQSSVPNENQIPVTDLMISLSPQTNRFRLRSKKLNKFVIPRLSNAHNFRTDSLPLYHFLGDLQFDTLPSGIFFNWGKASMHGRFFPRVSFRSIIVSPAQWQIPRSEFNGLIEQGLTDESFQVRFDAFAKLWRLPKLFLITDSDHKLLIDSRDTLSLRVLMHELKSRSVVRFEEHLFDATTCKISNNTKEAFQNEIMVFVKNEQSKVFHPHQTLLRSNENIKRKFPIGSEWVYFKIYCKPKTADLLLKSEIPSILSTLKEQELINKWFFIRYADPGFHLRLRFHIRHMSDFHKVVEHISRMLAPLVHDETIENYCLDTYERELERYSFELVDSAEEWFTIDSDRAISVIQLSDNISDRFIYGCMAIDHQLKVLGFVGTNKSKLLATMSQSFVQEFGAKKGLILELDRMFREKRKLIEESLESSQPPVIVTSLRNILSANTKAEQELGKHLNASTTNIDELFPYITSLIHMSINRVFESKPRTYELHLYYLMHKYYLSQHARQMRRKENVF